MELTDLASHAASGATGVVSMGWIAKALIQNWIKRQEAKDAANDKKADKTAEAMQSVAVELGKIGVRMEAFDKVADRLAKQAEDVAVLKTEMHTVKHNLNGLGAKLRSHPR